MSTIITISLLPIKNNAPRVFIETLERLKRSGNVNKVQTHDKHWFKNEQAIDFKAVDLNALAGEIFPSDKALQIEMDYRSLSGQKIWLSLNLKGQSFENGVEAAIDGPISITVAYSDIHRPLIRLENSRGKQALNSETARQVSEDWRQLFLEICGISEKENVDQSSIDHAAMYLEGGWPSGAGCVMLYHRDAQAFLRDFLHIYREFNQGATIPELLSTENGSTAGNAGESSPSQIADKLQFFQQFDSPAYEESIIDFLQNLSWQEATELQKPSPEECELLLIDICNQLPEVELEISENNGLAIMATPLSSIWRVYQRLKIRALQKG